MAYQSLNIIGSFTAGTTFVQNQVNADRDRIEAYRSLLKDQIKSKQNSTQDSESLIDDVDDRMTIGDAPEEQRTPYLLQRYTKPSPAQAQPAPIEPTGEAADSNAVPGSRLDTVV